MKKLLPTSLLFLTLVLLLVACTDSQLEKELTNATPNNTTVSEEQIAAMSRQVLGQILRNGDGTRSVTDEELVIESIEPITVEDIVAQPTRAGGDMLKDTLV